MAQLITAPGVQIDPSIFWPEDGLASANETLTGLVGQVGNLVLGMGNVQSTFNELRMTVGDLVYRYIGDWTLDVDSGLLGTTTSAEGSYNKIVIEKDGQMFATLTLDDALPVDLGDATGLSIPGLNLQSLTQPLLSTVLGPLDNTLDNLNLLATPDLIDIVTELLVPDDPQDPDPEDPDPEDPDPEDPDPEDPDPEDPDPENPDPDNPDPNNPNTPTENNDILHGDQNSNAIAGLAGNDLIYGHKGNDILHGNDDNDSLWGHAGTDQLFGDGGKDRLSGASGNDKLDGGLDNDKLLGDGGNDTLLGGAGADKLTGGRGLDLLTGGADNDVFNFTSLTDSFLNPKRQDVIGDFSQSDNDRISVAKIDADIAHRGNQRFEFIGDDGFSGDAGELRTYVKGGDTFVAGDVDGNGKADFAIRLEGAINLDASDFLL